MLLLLLSVAFSFSHELSQANSPDFIGRIKPKLVWSSSRHPLAYQIELQEESGQDPQSLTIPLEPNERLLSTDLTVESWRNGIITSKQSVKTRCLFLGQTVPESTTTITARAAVNLCDGLSAVVETTKAQYLIRPVAGPNATSTEHEVHRLRRSPSPSADARRADQMDGHGSSSGVARGFGRRPVTVELAVIADRDLIDFHGSRTEAYLFTIMNAVSGLYRDATLDDLVNVVLTRVILLEDDALGLSVSQNADATLDHFCEWQKAVNYPRGSRQHYDAAVLLTRKDICSGNRNCDLLGLANDGAACQPKRSCAVVQDTGLNSALVIAHELGHLLGMKHDGDDCSSGGVNQVMSDAISSSWGNNARWSGCSRQQLIRFLDDGRGECLADSQAVEQNFISTRRGVNLKGKLPGEVFAPDEQCRIILGAKAKSCHVRGFDKCSVLWCHISGWACRATGIPLADGTHCDKEKHCYQGKCTRKDIPGAAPVAGGWSGWSAYGTCSRTCGGGVRTSHRKCDNPRPENGGRYCDGDRVRFSSCAIGPCPAGAPSFRSVQCSAFDGRSLTINGKIYAAKWTAKLSTSKSNLCRLVCSTGTMVAVLAPVVIDGTSCGIDGRRKCVQGRCLTAGCDNVIGSNKTLDKCGVCEGDGLQCNTVEGELNLKHRGISKVLDIPAGASLVQITQRSSSLGDGSYLALQKEDGGYLFNGNYRIQTSKKVFSAAGTRVQYSGAAASQETIKVAGPTSEKLTLKVLNYNPNPSAITYRFSVKGESVGSDMRTSWVIRNVSSCSSSCGSGVIRRTVTCMQMSGTKEEKMVADSLCVKQKKFGLVVKCNPEPCPFWKTGPWAKCAGFCTNSLQFRTVQCVKTSGQLMPLTFCNGAEKPSNLRTCKAVCPKWHGERWSECSASCGGGVQSRTVKCIDGSSGKLLFSSSCVKQVKPAIVRECQTQRCAVWREANWTKCSDVCDGVQSREVLCVDSVGNKVLDSHCSAAEKPATSQKCSAVVGGCSGVRWSKTRWTKCDAACGRGKRRRGVSCVNQRGNKLPDSFCTGKKPTGIKSCKVKVPCASWRLGKWQECSATCGAGFSKRDVRCILPDGRETRETQSCGSKKPLAMKRCRRKACPSNSLVMPTPMEDCKDREDFCTTYADRYCSIGPFKHLCCHSCSRVVK